MNDLRAIPAELGLTETWEKRNGSQWISPSSLDLRRMASALVAHGARFITMTAMELPDDQGYRFDYHWDLDGKLLTFSVKRLPSEKKLASIYGLCPAADWIEREVHELFSVEFDGRDYVPLLVRPGDPIGVNLRKEDE